MKFKIFGIIILTILLSCGTSKTTTNATLNKDGDLIGLVTKNNFLQEPFNEWFSFNYNEYEINEEVIYKLKPIINTVKIKAFMGTWCGDSQEQTPAFYKVLEAAEFNFKKLEMVCLDQSKKSPNNLQKGYNINRVPTFIFYKNGVEIGRFVEYPRESIEEDFLKIVSEKEYKHSYEE